VEGVFLQDPREAIIDDSQKNKQRKQQTKEELTIWRSSPPVPLLPVIVAVVVIGQEGGEAEDGEGISPRRLEEDDKGLLSDGESSS